MTFILSQRGQTRATSNPTYYEVIVMVNFFALGGVGSYTEEVQFSTAETGIGETEEVSGHSSVGSPQMLPRQEVAGTPTPKKLDVKLCHQLGRKVLSGLKGNRQLQTRRQHGKTYCALERESSN